jgi:mannose-1-phosphate guanylyltransferase/mannose-6-phosphate isomerase
MKVTSKIYPVVLCGGSGLRLWPLSRRDFPKQFAVSKGGKSLCQRTFERADSYALADAIIGVGHQDYRFLIKDVMGKIRKSNLLLLEPASRNTAPAIASAAVHIAKKYPDAVLICMPSDHQIGSTAGFHRTLTRAVRAAAAGWITVLGVAPTYPATSFGYIKPGEPIKEAPHARKADAFAEKPTRGRALRYLREGYRWNSGVVVARADVLLDALARHVPDVLSACEAALSGAVEDNDQISLKESAFLACKSISFDYAVLEKEERVAVVDLQAGWSDVGNWEELAKSIKQDADGNRTVGDVRAGSCTGAFIYSPERFTMALGLRNIVVIDTADALLVAERSKLDDLKTVVGELTVKGRPEMVHHRRVAKPWGSYQAVDRGEMYQVKRITVKPGGVLSLQYHHHRAEHWVVVKGTALVTCGERQFQLKQNESTYIPQGAVHRLENASSEPLEIIEVQTGSYLGEDDIVRLSDNYGRKVEVKMPG